MATLTQKQIDAMKAKGLTDDKIQALASQKGYELPKESFGKKLIKSEIGFGQSLAGATGSTFLSGTKKGIDKSNEISSGIQTNLIKRIKEKRSKGEDTSRLLNALKTMDKEVNFYDILNESTGNSLDKTGKQVFGEALGVATDIASFGSYGTGAKSFQLAKNLKQAPTAIANTFGQGFKQGAKTGFKYGGTLGTAKGATLGMQDNQSLGGIVGSGIKGGIEGAIGGAALGGVFGGISGKLTGRSQQIASQKQLNANKMHALDLVSPKVTSKVGEKAMAAGQVSEPGILKPSKLIPQLKDYQMASSIEDVVSPKKSVWQNIQAIHAKITETDAIVRDYINKNKVPFNTGQLRNVLNKGQDELKLVFASDTNAERTYKAVVDEFIGHVDKLDTEGLLLARREVDKIPAIKKLLESSSAGENVKREVVLTVRRMANKYITKLLPPGSTYQDDMFKMTNMFDALENIAIKNSNTIGKNKLQILSEKYPALKWVIGGVGVGLTGAAGVGVGSALIGSSD